MPAPGQCLNEIDVAVLAGGLGTRIRESLGDTPKLLAPVAGEPFLDFLLAWLRRFGARRVVLGLGHLADRVTAHLGAHPPDGIEVVTAIEPEPLGTAGALRFLAAHIRTDPVLVMNGDSFIAADLCAFAAAHANSGAGASILAVGVEDAAAFGRLVLGEEGRIERFQEKAAGQPGPGLVNAGVYLFSAAMRARIDVMPGPSLERDVFQALAPGTLYAVPSAGPFVDIGTPEGLKRAAEVLMPYR